MFFKKPLKVEKDENNRVPPGQTVTDNFPVLTDGPAPDVEKSEWVFEIKYQNELLRSFDWEEFNNLKQETITTDIHCVTRWSKLDTVWNGVYVEDLLDGLIDPKNHKFVMAFCFGGYTTNLPIEDLMDKKGSVVTTFDGKDLEKDHGGPARLLVPHLYLWKSAKWVKGLHLGESDRPGYWEQYGYHMYGDPWKEQRFWND